MNNPYPAYFTRIIERFGWLRLIFSAFGLVIFLAAGISIFSVPRFEIMYNMTRIAVTHTEYEDIFLYTLEVGNTGRMSLEEVDVFLFTRAYEKRMLPIQVRNFGKFDRQVTIERGKDVIVIALGKLETGKRVEIDLFLKYGKGESPHTDNDVFRDIKSSRGKVLEGDPEFTSLGRFLYGMFGDLLPI